MIYDLLEDPEAVLDRLHAWLSAHVWQLAVTWIGAEVLLILLSALLMRLRHRRLARGARCVEILAPPVASMPGAEALWGNLIGLLRPAWKRLLLGQPHLAFEYLFTAGGMRIRLWVPGCVPQHLVENAIEAAWPSARTVVHEAAPPVPLDGQCTGGRLTLARGDRLPLRHNSATDPLRAINGATVGMPPWQHASVQILARPATGRRLAHVVRGLPFGLIQGLLDWLTPGPPPSRRHPAQSYDEDLVARLEASAEARAIRDKAHHSRYEVAIRYAVQTDPGGSKAVDTVRRFGIRG